jgi:hypothetical protein
MIDILNLLGAALSIGLGVIGWLAPRYTMEVLDTTPGATTMGISEVRAASGALFVGLGLGALLLGSPTAYIMVGAAWLGAAIGRATSIALDGPTRKKWGFFATEIVVGAGLIALNL